MKPPVTVTAALVGAFVDECGTGQIGTIASLHDSVVNVHVRADGRLLSLVHGAVDMSDRAICVPGTEEWALLHSVAGSAQPGAPVARRREALIVGAPPRSIVINLTVAAPWSGRLEPLLSGVPASTVRGAIGRLATQVARRDRGFAALADFDKGRGGKKDAISGSTAGGEPTDAAPSSPTGDDAFLRRARLILAEVDEERGAESLNALQGLVGLGRGFTPSGDDFVAGVALAFAARGVPLPGTFVEAIRRVLDRTTPGGATLLDLALRGSHPAYQPAFVRRFVAGIENSDFRAALAVLDGHGATSGFDMAAGFCWAGAAF